MTSFFWVDWKKPIPCWELTCPTFGKGQSSTSMVFFGAGYVRVIHPIQHSLGPGYGSDTPFPKKRFCKATWIIPLPYGLPNNKREAFGPSKFTQKDLTWAGIWMNYRANVFLLKCIILGMLVALLYRLRMTYFLQVITWPKKKGDIGK